ncbi:MAG: peptidoglycan editing factor PgeF [Anaerolineae bacterium]
MNQPLTPQMLDGARLYQAPQLGDDRRLLQAIFSRQGGFSQGPYRSLNLGRSVGDDDAAVTANLRKARGILGISAANTVYCHLVHGADVYSVSSRHRGQMAGYGDGLVTNEPGLILTMNYGDCVPLLFHDPARQVIGLAHAGWRGTMQNIAGAVARTMVDMFQCDPQNIRALIGPSIGPCCYEVGPEVEQAAAGAFAQSEQFFSRPDGSRAHFDLWAANHHQLSQAGVGTILEAGLCTACRKDEFFSHRAERGQTGRFGVFMGLRP